MITVNTNTPPANCVPGNYKLGLCYIKSGDNLGHIAAQELLCDAGFRCVNIKMGNMSGRDLVVVH